MESTAGMWMCEAVEVMGVAAKLYGFAEVPVAPKEPAAEAATEEEAAESAAVRGTLAAAALVGTFGGDVLPFLPLDSLS